MERDSNSTGYTRINIYLNDRDLKTQIKFAAARRGVSISAYCEKAIRNRLVNEGSMDNTKVESRQPELIESAKEAARELDQLRHKIGPISVPVRDLIDEGRLR